MDNFEFDKEMREELAEIGIEKGGYYEVSVEPERATGRGGTVYFGGSYAHC